MSDKEMHVLESLIARTAYILEKEADEIRPDFFETLDDKNTAAVMAGLILVNRK